MPLVREADVLLVAGGEVLYLAYWMRQSGLTDLLPSLSETVWVGLSAGSMVMTPEVGEDFIQWRPPTGDVSTLGLVDFSICPHLAPDGMPGNSMAEAERWAEGISGPAYVDRRADSHRRRRRRRRGHLRRNVAAVRNVRRHPVIELTRVTVEPIDGNHAGHPASQERCSAATPRAAVCRV